MVMVGGARRAISNGVRVLQLEAERALSFAALDRQLASLLAQEDNKVWGCNATRRANTNSRLQQAFTLAPGNSLIEGAGQGLFLRSGVVENGTMACLYPGTVYAPGDFATLVSFGNDYILRRNDGWTIDGKPGGLSGMVFRSCAGRDAYLAGGIVADSTWQSRSLSADRQSPFALGHLANEPPPGHAPNLMYTEIIFPTQLLAKYPQMYNLVPNAYYSRENMTASATFWMKGVGLLALRRIEAGEEMLVDYSFIASAQEL